MKKIFQIFVLIFAFIFVGILGFYAYKLSTDTLVFAFKNTQNQSGDTLILAVDRPGFLSRVIPAGKFLDEDILLSSVFYNNKKITLEEMENFEIMQNESFFSIKIKNPQKSDVLRFSSTEYNKNKRTSYNIPQDIVLEYSEEKQNFIIDKKYDFKNRGKYQFLVETAHKIEDIFWYLYYPIDGEKCDENGIYWDIRKYESIKPNIIFVKNSDGKILSEVYLDVNMKKKNRCILAGISNDIIPVIDENLPDFSMESSLAYALNPDDNLLSQIHFTLHSPIIPDFDEKSSEYEKWEQDLKKEMISKINISPSVEILPENIVVWKKSIDIIGDFEVGREYVVHLSDISDIYGRQISHKFSFIPQNNPFFALYSDKKFENILDAKVQILSTNTHKGIYELKMCRLDVESFFQISEIISEKNVDKISNIYDMMNSEHTSNCVKNNLEVAGKQNQEIMLNEFFEWEKKTGLYIVALRNLEDAQSFENPVFPVVFSVGDIDISAISDHKKLQIFLQNTNNPPYNLTFFPKNPEKNPETGNYFSTGVVFSSEKNIFEISFDDIKKQFQTRDFIVSVRDNSDFWYLYFTLPEEKKFLKNAISSIDNRIFLLWEKIKIFAELPFWEFSPEKTYILELSDKEGKIIQNTYMKPNQFGVFEWDFDSKNTGKIGQYILSIFEENNGSKEKISENIFFISEKKAQKNMSISLRGLNFDNNFPKNLREKSNIDENHYYKNIYFAPIQIEAVIEGEKSSSFANAEFSYKIFKKKIAKNTEQEFLLESKWKITENGKWYVIFSDEFETFYHDYEYIFEVTMSDVLTGEEYTSTSSFIVALPSEYKTFDDSILSEFVLHSDLIVQGEKLQVQLKNDEIMKNLQKYQYEIFQNIDAHSVLVTSGSLSDLNTDISLDNFSAWEYKIQISPLFENIPESLKISKNFWIEGKDFVLPTSLSIFSRENADKNELFIASPYQTGSMLIVRNTGENIDTELISYTGGSIKYNIENNANILLQIVNTSENKEKSESIFRFFPAKISQNLVISDFGIPERMKKWEEMKLDFSLQNLEKKWVLGEVWLEIKKKDEKYFSYKDIFINHKDVYTQIQTNSQIFSQEKIFSKNEKIMQNTSESIVYSERISKDKNGKISKNIPLDVDSGVYEILIFGYDILGNKTEIRKDFSVFEDIFLSATIPDLVYPDDKIALQVAVQNHTPEIALAQLEVHFSHPTHPLTTTGSILLNTFSSDERNFEIKIPKEWKGSVDYILNLKKWDIVLASKSGNIVVDEVPTIGLGRKILGVTTEIANLLPSSATFLESTQSEISLRLGRNWSVMIPSLLMEFENITTFSRFDEIRVEFAKKLTQSRGFETQFDVWKITKNISEPTEISEQTLDEWYYVFALKSLSADISPATLSHIENYFSENAIKKFDTFSWKNAIQVKILKIASLIQQNIFDEIFSKISPENLSENEFLDYLEAMQNMKKTANDDIINRLINTENTPQDALSDAVYYLKKAYILLWFDKRSEAEKILKNFYEQKIADVSGIDEKLWRLQVALRHAEKSPNSTINAKMISGNISAKTLLDAKNPLQFWKFEREKIREKIEITSERKFPLYYEFSEKNFLEAPALFLEKFSEHIRVTTNIEKIYENAGINESGEFALREEISENILQKNTLYKAKTIISLQNMEGKKSEDVIVKIFLPNFAEVYIPQNNKNFEIIRREKNAIFLIAKRKDWNRELEFSYYFRPNKLGIYLLPATFAYFSEAREFFANSSHNYFHIQ